MSNCIGHEFWTRVIAEYESRCPEQTHWDFVEEWGLKLTTFRSWLYRLRRERDADGDELALVPVEITGVGELDILHPHIHHRHVVVCPNTIEPFRCAENGECGTCMNEHTTFPITVAD